jgi:hypothetical protein
MATKRAPAKRPVAKAPLFARPEAKASTSARPSGSRVSGSARIEFTLIKIGTMFQRSKTVNRAARGKGAGGFFARMLKSGSKALTQGAAAGLKGAAGGGGDRRANGLTSEHSNGPLLPAGQTSRSGGGDSAGFERFKASRPDLFDGPPRFDISVDSDQDDDDETYDPRKEGGQ